MRLQGYISILLLLFVFLNLDAQELNCNVTVISPQVQSTDKHIYDNMQKSIQEFMNTTKWSEDKFLVNEKIECNIFITISSQITVDEFQGKIQVQSVRPVFDASYNSPIFNYLDEDFRITYVEHSTIEYSEGSFTSNLSAILAYYAYVIIGYDYDSYSKLGGTDYFKKALNIANQAQTTPYSGWEAVNTKKSNRYWLINQIFDPDNMTIREIIYNYHRLGLDKMTKEPEAARSTITESLIKLRKIYRDEPNSLFLQVFLTAKRDEIANIFSEATSQEKDQILELAKEIDGPNYSKYSEKLKKI